MVVYCGQSNSLELIKTSIMKNALLVVMFICSSFLMLSAQNYWQQEADYTMDIDMDVNTHRYQGKQKLVYTNHSPSTLHKAYYHLYFNAFQPGSMMDVRSLSIDDPDRRVSDRISKLSSTEEGYCKISSLKQDGQDVRYEYAGTILKVTLNKPIAPGETSTFEMTWESQVPLQIRRSGRDNAEGVDYSMAQWYPKMSEYDEDGWHPNQYVGREFYGIWGDWDVTIRIDPSYEVGATGILSGTPKTENGKKVWNFKAENVHDFVWGADPDYTHTMHKADDGTEMHFYYIPGEKTEENWKKLPEIMANVFPYVRDHFGTYGYTKYSFIQGGDGGMEYPMATLITGERSLNSLVGVSVHELMHSWYQMMLGFDEAQYAWMDEGFTSYASTLIMNKLYTDGTLSTSNVGNFPFEGAYKGYGNLVKSGKEEPLTTLADHFNTNFGYSLGSYVKGQVFLSQLGYVIGEDALAEGLLALYDRWKFKHPHVNDVVRVFEEVSDIELDWYQQYWVNTTKTIDYAIDTVVNSAGSTTVTLSKNGLMPMPIDLTLTKTDGSVMRYNIPLVSMYGKKAKDGDKSFTYLDPWPWTNPSYEVKLPIDLNMITRIEIDDSMRMADVFRENNVYSK